MFGKKLYEKKKKFKYLYFFPRLELPQLYSTAFAAAVCQNTGGLRPFQKNIIQGNSENGCTTIYKTNTSKKV
jgi:hypothetical protein